MVCRLIWICRIQWCVPFFWFRLEIRFWGKFGPGNQNCQFQLKFGTKTNLNMQNSVVLFTFSVFDWKYLFRSKFYHWIWSLVPSKFWICRIHKLFTFFQFWEDILFLGKFGPKSQNCQFKLKFGTLTNSNIQSLMVVLTFSVFLVEMLFMGKFDLKKSKLSV